MLVLLAPLTALTSANWFIWLPSAVGRSVQPSHEYLPGWDEASLPSGPDSIPLCNWFLKKKKKIISFSWESPYSPHAYTRISDPLWTPVRPSGGDCFRSMQNHAGEHLPPHSPGKYTFINTIFYEDALKQESAGTLAFTKSNMALRAFK